MKIKVYFTNGNAVVMEAEKVLFIMPPIAQENEELIQDVIRDGYTVVNLYAVSWVRKYEEPEE